ncbi:MAG: CBS domain-containing protein [Candidatus Omnitrophica bacterium]|nr:CBS domain-containing protein [Candidatus Omnitrophota bacterium]
MGYDVNRFCIGKDLTIKEVMKRMDTAARKILFVTTEDKRLLGALTDGDIRRWILEDGDLSEPAENIYNKKPKYLSRGISKIDERKAIFEEMVEALPVVDEQMRVVDLVFLKDAVREDISGEKADPKLKVPVVIMVGGKGKRLDPVTRILPKALIPIGDKPVVEMIIDKFREFTSADIYFILGHKATMVKSYFNDSVNGYNISYLYEGEKALGTAGGLKMIPEDFPGTFFLSNCDNIIKADYTDVYQYHKDKGYDLTIVGSMQHFVLPYGVMEINSGGELKQIMEKPEYDYLVNTGMYVVEKNITEYIPGNTMFHITDLIKALQKNGKKIGVYPISEKSWLDVGQWESYKETASHLLEKLEG